MTACSGGTLTVSSDAEEFLMPIHEALNARFDRGRLPRSTPRDFHIQHRLRAACTRRTDLKLAQREKSNHSSPDIIGAHYGHRDSCQRPIDCRRQPRHRTNRCHLPLKVQPPICKSRHLNRQPESRLCRPRTPLIQSALMRFQSGAHGLTPGFALLPLPFRRVFLFCQRGSPDAVLAAEDG